MHCLLLIIELDFTCGEMKLCYNIKKSQNIMKMIIISDVVTTSPDITKKKVLQTFLFKHFESKNV